MATEYEIKKQICEIGKRIYNRNMVAANDGNISVKLSDNPSQAQIDAALEAEAKLITEKIPKGAACFAMCIEGKQYPSEKFSTLLETVGVEGGANVVFIIGSSFGLSPTVKQMCKYKLSMSEMTFPHQLARVMLLEQIYRAFQISNGGKYHK